MTVGVESFRGKRLKEARLARGLYKSTLGDLVGVSGTAITRYEEGLDNPQRERLDLIANKLNFPLEFFVKPEWGESAPIIFWRSRASESKFAREMTEQRVAWLCELFYYLEGRVDFPNSRVPALDVPSDFRLISSEMIEYYAEKVRTVWKLGDEPIPDVLLALENAGIPVVCLKIESEKQDGFCFRSKMLSRTFVGINTHNISSVRARYDAAHELGHAVLHTCVTPQQERDPVWHKIIEQQAHRFAGAFLFPRNAFRAEVSAPTLNVFASLKRRWGMSVASMVYRASDLGLIDELERGFLYRNMGRRGWRGPLQEPYDSPEEMKLERPRMLKRGIDVLVNEGGMLPASIQSALALPANEIERLAGLNSGFFDAREVVQLAKMKRNSHLKTVDFERGEIIEFPSRSKI